ncbi:MAG: S-layer protein, partial [Candidatus Altiarchaeales archaeon]|nr:S-layer protein [Candidatus Altiarchaeales archaeon]
MKSMDIKRIGTIATGAMMLGAALVGPVSAGMDDTGLTGNFFYDASYNPIMQIVVGEKGMATDAVAAGNIAAAVGNLAYMESTKTLTLGGEATGKVVVETEARGAVGKYVQDTEDVTIRKGFYDADLETTSTGDDRSLIWDDEKRKYERGDFTHYSLAACKDVEETEAAILTEMTSSNVHCLFCQTLCLEALENPSHEMKESITVDNDKLWYYESGVDDSDKAEYLEMGIDKEAIKYEVKTGYLPMERLIKDATNPSKDNWVDFEYRGKILFFGEEYYVKDIPNAGPEDPTDSSNAKIV